MSDIFLRLAGKYVGQPRVREGREHELAPTERKRYLNPKETLDLELLADGTFVYKVLTTGGWAEQDGLLSFKPTHFSGQTLEQMREKADEQGREFRLGFLFDPFQLKVHEECLLTPDDRALIYFEYRKRG